MEWWQALVLGVVEGLTGVVSNAIDACEAGDAITITSELKGSPSPQLIVTVEDTGSGIAEEALPRVLDPFFTTKPIGEGSGLGLAITRRVMEEHGGTVEVTSELGQGTRVSLTFLGPQAQANVDSQAREL